MLHGSDYPVPVHGHFAWMRGFVDWKTFRRWEKHPNILERDYQLKLAMGLPREGWTQLKAQATGLPHAMSASAA